LVIRRGDGYQLSGQGLKVCRLVRDRQRRDANELGGLEGTEVVWFFWTAPIVNI
jgi:hypothetical protein